MINNLELKNKYYEFMEKVSNLQELMDENMKYCEKYPRHELFGIFEDDDYYDFFIEALKERDDYKDIDLDKLREDYNTYKRMTGYLIDDRIKLYEDYMKTNIEFDEWSTKMRLTYKIIDTWRDERDWYEIKWRDWSSNHVINDTMHKSIEMTDEKEIEKMIENARKVLKLVNCTEEHDCWEVHFCLWGIETINKYIRYNIFNGADNVFAVDCLENRGMYCPDREGFMMGVLRVMELVDNVFIHLCKDVDCI